MHYSDFYLNAILSHVITVEDQQNPGEDILIENRLTPAIVQSTFHCCSVIEIGSSSFFSAGGR